MKWIQRVIIEDFQSHRLTELELVEGFNVIVGPSDQGKTAVLRAIRWVLYNEPKGNDFIRVGSNKAKVTLVMNDGTIVSRERTSSRNRYVVAVPGVEEQIYEGFGHSVPEEVMEVTGVRPLKMDEDHQVAINIGMQLDSPFLLESNGSIKAKAIGRINGVHILDYAHKTTSSELNSKQTEERRVQAELDRREQQLLQYEDLDLWERSLQKVENGLKRAEELESRIQWLKEKKEQKLDLSKKLRTAEEFLAQLVTLDHAAEEWRKAEALSELGQRLVLSQGQLKEIRASLHTSRQWIEQTKHLSEAERGLEQALVLQERERAIRKSQESKASLAVEMFQMNNVLGRTDSLPQVETAYQDLKEILSQEEKLRSLQNKAAEYKEIERKIQLVLTKTRDLQKAQELWEAWQASSQRCEQLEGLLIKKHELKKTLNQMDFYLSKSEQLGSASEKWEHAVKSGQKIDSLMSSLNQLYTIKLEKKRLAQEIQESDSRLETWAKQYFEHLKQMGRCPICLGEIENHTVERIVSEIG